ncbi:hypothetical protein [Ralstonia sp. UBA689]|uniref:hypothetical protein n=1 Tax=Ralstonia sp. UBA689 TaxID=1947373 RepID=UPI0025D09199|nr:hypothetical protein [Ralstonia sp. UBA689]
MEQTGMPQTQDDTRVTRLQAGTASVQDWIDRHPVRAPVLALCVLALTGLTAYGLASLLIGLLT